MRKISALLAGAAFVAALAVSTSANEITVTGEIVDVACAIKKAPAGQGDDHAACAMACAKRGLAVGLLTADDIYTIGGDYAADNNAKLLDFVAKKVEVTGEVTEADGTKTLTIKSIKLAN